MTIKLMSGIVGLWCGFLAAGTWILPMGGLLLLTPSARAAPIPMLPDEDEEAAAAAIALASEVEVMRLAGEFDRPAFMFESVDLNGDGVGEIIEVSPPQQLETPGWMRVFDGATEAALYLLQPPIDEMGFGEHAAVVSDCDGDGLPELAVWSWIEVAQASSPLSMEVRIRVFAGANGDLIGILRAQREVGENVVISDFVVEIAADANLDGAIDVVDIIEASAAVGTEAALTPTVDCKADGELTVADLGAVIQRAVEEPAARRVQLYSVGLRNLALVQPIAPPGDGIDPISMGGGAEGGGGIPCAVAWQGWGCWLGLGVVVTDFIWLMAALAKCTGPQALICIVAELCHLARFITELIGFVQICLTNGQCLPSWLLAAAGILALVAAICSGAEKLTDSVKTTITDWLRSIGKKLGEFRFSAA